MKSLDFLSNFEEGDESYDEDNNEEEDVGDVTTCRKSPIEQMGIVSDSGMDLAPSDGHEVDQPTERNLNQAFRAGLSRCREKV